MPTKEDTAAIKIQKRIRGILMRTKYKKLLKVRKYVYVYRVIEGYTLVPDDTLEKHQFETFVWLDLLTEKITFNLFSVSKRKFKLKGVLKFEVEQTDNFDLLKDRARAFSKAHLQKLAIENNTVVFGEGNAAVLEYDLLSHYSKFLLKKSQHLLNISLLR